MITRAISCTLALGLFLLPAAVCHALTVVQDPANDDVWFQAGQYDSLSNPGTSVIYDNLDGTLTTTVWGDESSLATYMIDFANAGDYFLYFRVDDNGGDSVFVNHQTGFNSVPGRGDAERWNSIDTGWAGLYKILGHQFNYSVLAGDPAWGWNVASPSTVSLTVRNREADFVWKDFVFSKNNSLTSQRLNRVAGLPVAPIVEFEYTQTDRDTGFGTLSAFVDVIEFFGEMPAAAVCQNDSSGLGVPAGMVGYMDGVDTESPGTPFGVHTGWEDVVVTLRGEKRISDTEVENYEWDVPLMIADDGTPEADWRWIAEVTDDGGNGNDAFGTDMRMAGWVGDPTDGVRYSAPTIGDFVSNAVDAHTVIADFSAVGSFGRGDNLGITLSFRSNSTFGVGSGPVYVDSLTLLGGLSPDPSTIVMVTEPACDFNDDDACNIMDLNSLLAVGPVAPGGPAAGMDQFDLTGDGVINNDDVAEWLAIAATENSLGSSYKLGDATLDGVVDGQDFISWNGSKFTSTLAWDEGDFNGDGVVDGQDFILWNGNKFTSSDVLTAVPEAGPELLSVLAILLLGVVRRFLAARGA